MSQSFVMYCLSGLASGAGPRDVVHTRRTPLSLGCFLLHFYHVGFHMILLHI